MLEPVRVQCVRVWQASIHIQTQNHCGRQGLRIATAVRGAGAAGVAGVTGDGVHAWHACMRPCGGGGDSGVVALLSLLVAVSRLSGMFPHCVWLPASKDKHVWTAPLAHH